MKTSRQGTRNRIAARLREHAERMARYQAAGMSKEDASRLAYADMMAESIAKCHNK